MNINLKSLVGKLNATCRQTLESAAGLCLSRTNFDVEIEHWLFKLNEAPNTDFQRLLRHFGINQTDLSNDLTRAIGQLKSGNTRTPSISPHIIRLLNGAWLFASIDFDNSRIRSSHLLLALLADDELVQATRNSSKEWERISAESLHRQLLDIVKGSEEDNEPADKAPTQKVEALSSKIFISYRRDDSAGWAGRLYDRLGQHFDKNNLFMDVDTIEPGLDFVEVIQNSVAACDVLIAVIGRHWLDSMDLNGQRRLDNEEDYVRLEIATALVREIRVIPVLLQGTSMPRSKDLPDDLKLITRRNAHQMDDARFDHDVKKLIGVLQRKEKK